MLRAIPFRFVLAVIVGACHSQAQQQQTFVSIYPCRLVDTRASNGGRGPIPGGTYQTFTIGGNCQVPSSASAYSLNVAAVPPSSLLYLSVLPAESSTPTTPPNSSTLNDPSGTIVANAAIVPAGTGGAVTVYVSDTSNVILDIDGYFVGAGVIGSSNSKNTALGSGSLNSASSGTDNTAIGSTSLILNSTGQWNTAVGSGTLNQNSSGSYNVALGFQVLGQNTTGTNNTGVGLLALGGNTNGNNNTAIGDATLTYLRQGSQNIALGSFAGNQLASGSDNIYIGYDGTTGSGSVTESRVIHLGQDQSSTYVAAISGATVVGSAVLVDPNTGQLGVQSSSIRFKENVHNMADSSDALMQLRPVEFQYKQAEADGSKPLQFGLIAEEVAKVYPELVVRNKDGQIDTVQYHQLPAMLLNEIQKQHRLIEIQRDELGSMKSRIETLEKLLIQNQAGKP